MWRKELAEGYLEGREIAIELTVGGECGDYLPSLAIYDKERNMWYYFDNDIPVGATPDEAVKNAIEFLERVIIGLEEPALKISPVKGAPEEVYEKLERFLKGLRDEG